MKVCKLLICLVGIFILLKGRVINVDELRLIVRLSDNKIGVRFINDKNDFDILYYGNVDRCNSEWEIAQQKLLQMEDK